MSAEAWTSETEELVAREIAAVDRQRIADVDEVWRSYREQARSALAVILPLGTETNEEWVAESDQPSGAVSRRWTTEPGDVAAFLSWMRTDDPYGKNHRLLRRHVHYGPWSEVPS